MNDEVLGKAAAARFTRRKVVTTGTKLAYAAPLVAASFKLGSGGRVLAKDKDEVQCCERGKVGVCHAVEGQGELKNGFNFICVDEHSTDFEGHNNHVRKDGTRDIFPVKCSDECGGTGAVSPI